MTDLELLQKCIAELGGISIPTVLIEQIGIPVYNVRQNLIALMNSVQKKSAEQKTEPAKAENESK